MFFTYTSCKLNYLFNICVSVFTTITHRNTSPFFNLYFEDFSIMKMISAPNPTINLQSGVRNNIGVIDRWHCCKFVPLEYRGIEINTYSIVLIFFMTILIILKKLPFFDHMFIGVNKNSSIK